jgi:hypothetical protein
MSPGVNAEQSRKKNYKHSRVLLTYKCHWASLTSSSNATSFWDSFPTHGICLRHHRREHPRLPHPGECHKWVLRDLSHCSHPHASVLPPTTGDEISMAWDPPSRPQSPSEAPLPRSSSTMAAPPPRSSSMMVAPPPCQCPPWPSPSTPPPTLGVLIQSLSRCCCGARFCGSPRCRRQGNTVGHQGRVSGGRLYCCRGHDGGRRGVQMQHQWRWGRAC